MVSFKAWIIPFITFINALVFLFFLDSKFPNPLICIFFYLYALLVVVPWKLAPLTLIKLFTKMLKFSTNLILKEFFFVKQNRESMGIFIFFGNEIFKFK